MIVIVIVIVIVVVVVIVIVIVVAVDSELIVQASRMILFAASASL